MRQYKNVIMNVIIKGEPTKDRTGMGTQSYFGDMIKFDLSNGFPAVTVKKLAWKAVVSELIWFIRGSSNVDELREILHGPYSNKKTIWDANYDYAHETNPNQFDSGDLGPIYGVQWRDWFSLDDDIDQLKNAIELIKNDPTSRRIIVNSWKVDELDEMALPPCHYSYQFSVKNGKLNLAWNQRSVDVFLGLPFNIASYALLLHIVAKITGLQVGELTGFLGDVHLYDNAIDAAQQVVHKQSWDLPKLWINPELNTLEDFEKSTIDDFKLINYQHHEQVKVEMAV